MPGNISDDMVETGRFLKERWHGIISRFEDLNIYQTWPYDARVHGQGQVEHLVLRDHDRVLSAAQVRLKQVPALRSGVAYVRWGPLWNVKGTQRDPEIFRRAVRALRDEYVLRRGYLLRIFPALFQDQDQDLRSILIDEGYSLVRPQVRERTLLLNIELPLPELRKNLDQKWRNGLNRAEKNDLEVLEGEGQDLFEEFTRLYRDLLKRKNFRAPNNISDFSAIQQSLPEGWKMRVFLCRSQGSLGAGAICSSLGRTGLYLFGASNELGMTTKGSYVIQWRIIQWLKESGAVWYDLNGINPDANPGTYRFKAGIAGKSGRDVLFLGQFESYSSMPGRLLSMLVSIFLPLSRRIRAHTAEDPESRTGGR